MDMDTIRLENQIKEQARLIDELIDLNTKILTEVMSQGHRQREMDGKLQSLGTQIYNLRRGM